MRSLGVVGAIVVLAVGFVLVRVALGLASHPEIFTSAREARP